MHFRIGVAGLLLLTSAGAAWAQNPQNGSWLQREAMNVDGTPLIRLDHAAAAAGGNYYVYGGWTVIAGQALVPGHSMMKYEPVADSWTSLSGIPPGGGLTWVGWTRATGVGLGGAVYQFGGRRATNADPSEVVDASCWKYDIASMTWTEITSLPLAVENLRVVVVGTTVHAMGGLTGSGALSNGNHRMDLASTPGTWTAQLPIPTATHSQHMGEIGGLIYLAGGIRLNPSGVAIPSNITRLYTPSGDSWSVLANMPYPRHGGVAGSVGGRLYVAGGTVLLGPMVTLEYNPVANSWASKGSCSAFSGTQAAVADRQGLPRIYVAGGFANAAGCEEYTAPLPPFPPAGLFMRRPNGAPILEGGWAGGVVEFGATVEDPNAGDTVQFELEVALDGQSFPGTPAATLPPVAAGNSPQQVTVQVTFPTAGLWKWRCRGRDSGGNPGPWSLFGDPAVSDVNIDLVPPGAPQPVSPVNTDANVTSQGPDGGIVQFEWNAATDNSPFPCTYEIEVTGPAGAFQAVPGTTVGIWLPVSRYTYAWRVRAIDHAGNIGLWSWSHTFFVYYDDGIDHGKGDAARVCGGVAPGTAGGPIGAILLAGLLLSVRGSRRR